MQSADQYMLYYFISEKNRGVANGQECTWKYGCVGSGSAWIECRNESWTSTQPAAKFLAREKTNNEWDIPPNTTIWQRTSQSHVEWHRLASDECGRRRSKQWRHPKNISDTAQLRNLVSHDASKTNAAWQGAYMSWMAVTAFITAIWPYWVPQIILYFFNSIEFLEHRILSACISYEMFTTCATISDNTTGKAAPLSVKVIISDHSIKSNDKLKFHVLWHVSSHSCVRTW